jgi:DNA-binding PadR family transcriptional regulator
MRFRVGLLAGLAVGYYLGTKAGRERYEQIRRWLDDARQSRPFEKAQAAVELGLERVREQREAVTGASTNGPGAPS